MTAPTLPTGNNNTVQLAPHTNRISKDGSVVLTWRKNNTNVTEQTLLTPNCGAKKNRFDALSVLTDNSLSLRHISNYTLTSRNEGFFEGKELQVIGINGKCGIVMKRFLNGKINFITPDLGILAKLGKLSGLMLYNAFETWTCKEISRIGEIEPQGRITNEPTTTATRTSLEVLEGFNLVSAMEHTLRNTKAENDHLDVHLICQTGEGGLITKNGLPLLEVNKKLMIAINGLSDEQKSQAKIFLEHGTSTEINLEQMVSPNQATILLGFTVPSLTHIYQKLVIKIGEKQYDSAVCLYNIKSLQDHAVKYAAFANIQSSVDSALRSPAPATPDSANASSWTVDEHGSSVPVFETSKTQSPKAPGTPCTPSGWFSFVETIQRETSITSTENPKTPETPSERFFNIPSNPVKPVESKKSEAKELKRKTDLVGVVYKSSSEDEKKKTKRK